MTAALVTTDVRERREAAVRAHVEAENRHDVEGVIATFHHACYDVVPLGVLSDGAPAVHEFLSGVLTGFPDFGAHVSTLHHSERSLHPCR